MQLRVALKGTFKRTLVGTGEARVSLEALLPQLVAMAVGNYDGTTRKLSARYGLDLMLEPTLVSLVGAVVETEEGESPFLSRAAGRLRRDRRLHVAAGGEGEVGSYRYTFSPAPGTLGGYEFDLSAGDVRLPTRWPLSGEAPGSLALTLKAGVCNEFPEADVAPLWEHATALLGRFSIQEYGDVLGRLAPGACELTIPLGEEMALLLSPKDLPEPVGALWAIANATSPEEVGARLNKARSAAGWSRVCEDWLVSRAVERRSSGWLEVLGGEEAVQPKFPVYPGSNVLPDCFIGRGVSLQVWRDLIRNARGHLLVASYIIEDLELARLIAEQAQRMPGRVRVLCNLKETFLEHLPRLLGQEASRKPLPASDVSKLECLRVLLAAPLMLYHSEETHLKACVSERRGFLGSANLTPKSLRYNLESGAVFDDGPTLAALHGAIMGHIERAPAMVHLTPDGTGLLIEAAPGSRQTRTSALFLPPRQYLTRLSDDLGRATTEVLALTYTASSGTVLLSAGAAHLRRSIAVDAALKLPHEAFSPVQNCHAKVVVLDRKVAYLGSSNAPGPKAGRLFDLMFRIDHPVLAGRLAEEVRCLL
jgi:hypothetical protein